MAPDGSAGGQQMITLLPAAEQVTATTILGHGPDAAAAVVDQRRLIGRLVLCGTEVSTLQRARRLQTVLPLAVATIGSVVIGLGGSFLLMVGFGLSAARLASPNVGVLGLIVVAAIAIIPRASLAGRGRKMATIAATALCAFSWAMITSSTRTGASAAMISALPIFVPGPAV